MPLDLDVRNVVDSQKLVEIVGALNPRTGFSEVGAALGRISGGPFPTEVIPRSPPVPDWLWCDTGNQVIVAAAGVMSASDGLTVFASSLQPLVQVGTWAASSTCVSAARNLFSSLSKRYQSGPRRWVLTGHSYGGAMLAALAGLLSNAGVVQQLQLATFGSPRPGDSTLASLLTRFTVRRWMNRGDPVPRFPPHLSEAAGLVLFNGFPLALQWSRYVQPSGGVVVDRDGGLVVAELPAQVLPVADLELVAWALSDRGFFNSEHSLLQYRIRMALAAHAAADMPPTLVPGSRPEAAAVLTQAEFLAALVGGAAILPVVEGKAMAQGFIPPLFRAKEVRLANGTYAVQWMSGTIMVGRNRSNARSLASKLNLFLRTMQGAASADHTSFNAQLANYWLVCTEATLGFNPALVVT